MKKLIVLAAVFCMLATSAYAASEWSFYGSARVHTMYTSTETPPATTDTDVYSQALSSGARIGANVKASDAVSGRFEYGHTTTANLRLLYGTWNFGAGSLIVGQDYTPIFNMYSNSIYGDDLNMLTYGASYSGREAQLKLRFGNFDVALLQPNTAHRTGATGGTAVAAGTNSEVNLPGIEASYRFAQDNWHVKLSGGYQTFDVFNGTTAYDIDTYLGAIGAGVTFGPASLSGTLYAGQNAGHMISISTSNLAAISPGQATFNAGTTNVTDRDCFGWRIVGTYKVNDMFSFEAGVSGAEVEYDTTGAISNDVTAYYLQSVITLAPGVIVVPEIGMVDFNESGENEVTYIGAKWQISF